MKQFFNSILFTSIFVFPLLLSQSCAHRTDEKEDTAETVNGQFNISTEQFNIAAMELGKIESIAYTSDVYATGILDVPPNKRADINVYFGGYVKKVDILPGEKVEKGDVLFVLEDPSYLEMQSEYLQSRDALKYLEADYQRQKKLKEDSITSVKKYLKAEEDYLSAKAKYQSLYQKLLLMNIDPNQITADNLSSSQTVRSPISGTISEINLNLGSYIGKSEKALSILATDHLHIELKIFEKDLGKVSEGQKISFTTQNNPSMTYIAEVYLINRHIEPKERSIGIHAHIEEDSSYTDLYPGMYVEAKIISNADTLASVVESAVVEKEGKYYLAVLESKSDSLNVFREVEVLIGRRNENYIEILNHVDFDKDQLFLSKGAYNLIQE